MVFAALACVTAAFFSNEPHSALSYSPPSLIFRIRGLVLGGLVEKGMTADRVARILGNEGRASGGFAGSSSFYTYYYWRHGLLVSLASDVHGVPRVTSVSLIGWQKNGRE